MSYIIKNFSNGLLASAIGAGDVSLTVNNGHTLPTTSGTFVAVIWNPTFYSDPSKDPGTEIVLASYTSTNLYAITRAQESTSASSHPTGSAITCAITAGLLQNLNLGGVSFVSSLTLVSGTASLLNDSASPGNSYYYGTNGSGTKGFFVLPAGLGIPIPTSDGGTGSTANANAANGVVVLDASSKLPAVDGSLLTGLSAGGYTGMQVFTSSGTWTKPTGVSKVFVRVLGAGGGSGGDTSGSILACGGGSGGYSEKILTVTGNVSVTVGTGGTGSTNNGSTPGGDGGASSFGTFCYGNGGKGGQRSQVPGVGGTATGGDLNVAGSTGHPSQGTFVNWNTPSILGESAYGYGGGWPDF